MIALIQRIRCLLSGHIGTPVERMGGAGGYVITRCERCGRRKVEHANG